MEAALEDCKNGSSICAAAKKNGVSETTLRRRLKGGPARSNGGQNRKLSLSEEQLLVDILVKTANMGVPLDPPALLNIIDDYCVKKGKGACTRSWYRSFRQRHPGIGSHLYNTAQRKKRKGQITTGLRTEWTNLLRTLQEEGYLANPAGIFNLNQTFLSIADFVCVSCEAEQAKEYEIEREELKMETSSDDSTSARKFVTVLACASANGVLCRPLIEVDDDVCLASRMDRKVEKDVFAMDRDITESSVFTKYIKREVLPRVTLPKNVVFVEGYSSCADNLEFVVENMETDKRKIKVVSFPAGHSQTMHPADLVHFEPLKKYWRSFVQHHGDSLKGQVAKEFLARFIKDKWHSLDTKGILTAGFREMGIYPYNAAALFEPIPSPNAHEKDSAEFRETYKEQLREIEALLQTIHPLSSQSCDEIITYVVKMGTGSAGEALDLAVEFRNFVVQNL